MSWFDTKGLASLAKNALKEAQKQIDKALDIQDIPDTVEDFTVAATAESIGVGGTSKAKSKTEPSTPITPTSSTLSSSSVLPKSSERGAVPATWGSFTGSFFENPNASEMITTPPQRIISIIAAPSVVTSISPHSPHTALEKRQSVTSNSDSVELLSPPTSPCSGLTSPSDAVYNSESVELITTPLSCEMISPDSGQSLPESIVIIASDEIADDDDDSMSYNTVMDDSVVKQSINEEDAVKRSNNSSITPKILMSFEEALFESQTVTSDSTQSFEDVLITDTAISVTSDDKDMVKINSGPSSSDQNSNDEIETTTSSDIEIISNPNGDSSSTNSASRASPHKLSRTTVNSLKSGNDESKNSIRKGHFREPSEISIQSEDSQSDTEKLLYRISELSEILEARELRLLEFGRHNAALQEKNHDLQTALDTMKRNAEHIESEDYTQRLSALEKKFQMSIRERDSLRLQVKTLKEEFESKIPKDDLTKVVAESNSMIVELRSEGEKLAKQVLQQSNIIKKLRAKEKSSDAVLKKNKEQIIDLTDEVERLKKTLNAKENVERSQIEAVHKISSEKRILDTENQQFRGKIEDLSSKLSTMQASFNAVKVELQTHSRINSDLTRTAEEVIFLQKEKDKAQTENKDLLFQLNKMREKLRVSELGMTMREQKLREENSSLLRRIEESESRAENLTQEVSLTTIPLMRQMESLQSTLTQRTNNWEKQERELLRKLELSQSRLKSLENVENNFKEKINILQNRCLDLEAKLSHALMQEEKSKIALHQAELDFNVMDTNSKRQISNLNNGVEEIKSDFEDLMGKYKVLVAKYESERVRADVASERHRKLSALSDVSHEHIEDRQQQPGDLSPAVSLGRNSIEDAIGGSIDWQVDDLDCISSSGRQATSMYGMHISLPSFGNNASTLEHLQSILKQRDGEISQLQWELSRLQVERGVLNSEISNLTLELENIKEKLQTHEILETNFSELQHQYDALLQMYGEKVEKAEELELDLQDVKDMYKAQINDLLRHQNCLTASYSSLTPSSS